jgi:hypothetical protein
MGTSTQARPDAIPWDRSTGWWLKGEWVRCIDVKITAGLTRNPNGWQELLRRTGITPRVMDWEGTPEQVIRVREGRIILSAARRYKPP